MVLINRKDINSKFDSSSISSELETLGSIRNENPFIFNLILLGCCISGETKRDKPRWKKQRSTKEWINFRWLETFTVGKKRKKEVVLAI